MNDLEERLLRSPRVPTLPVVAQRILDLLSEEEVDLERLTSTIECDAALTAKILRLINSPLYGLTREIVSLREAALYLGVNAVHRVALSFSFISSLRSDGADGVIDAMWRCSLLNALAARRLATEVGGWDPEEAFLAGLVADCGPLVLLNLLPEYREILARFRAGESDLLELERASIDTDHMRMAGFLLDRWRFPDHFKIVVARHHEPSELPPGSIEEFRGRILNAAWLCARSLAVPGFSTEVASVEKHVATLLGIPTSVAQAIVAELPDELRETASAFEIPVEEQQSFEELLMEANERLSELAIASEQLGARTGPVKGPDMAGFVEVRAELSERLSLESRTQLLTRDSFEMLLGAFHRRARLQGTPIGLMLIEIDELKDLEAQIGPAAVEDLLAELALRLGSRLRGGDQLGRMGFGEIAALAPGCPLDALLAAAGRLLAAIESTPLEVAGRSVQCRASIGVAAARPDRDGLDPRALLSLAGSSLDQARASGESISCCQ